MNIPVHYTNIIVDLYEHIRKSTSNQKLKQ